jgi:hypothetical protein
MVRAACDAARTQVLVAVALDTEDAGWYPIQSVYRSNSGTVVRWVRKKRLFSATPETAKAPAWRQGLVEA